MYKVGDQVVYSGMGVCSVQDICVPDLPGAVKECYLLRPVYQPETKVYAPVEKQAEVMRPIMTQEETLSLIDAMPALKAFEDNGDRMETQRQYKSALRSISSESLARLVKTLYEKRRRMLDGKKPLPGNEKELLYNAEQLLNGEVAHSLRLHMEDVPGYITARLGSAYPLS